MTRQEMLNKACDGIMSQGKPSIDPTTGDCRYNGGDGYHCALGWLAPDAPWLEYNSLSAQPLVIQDLFSSDDNDFIGDLQFTHDEAAAEAAAGVDFIEDFKRRIREFAAFYKLTVPANVA